MQTEVKSDSLLHGGRFLAHQFGVCEVHLRMLSKIYRYKVCIKPRDSASEIESNKHHGVTRLNFRLRFSRTKPER